ncbi:glutamate ABC transporter substrate-binding protein [Streptomyces paludis]|uniref:Sugar-binding protein n=1 Tax=Streptomyces paludis TaxID=2282738 RepID=A0A345I0K6_9ACTN|nr:glutamate ABC transporter substrate-binding protein [Streptomyces paludis]AXG82480.1 sugar-binding protein [Streptomyces paludis]
MSGPSGTFRTSGRFRGWGGVSAMVAACVLTGTLTLLPLSSVADGEDYAPERISTAVPAAADDCEPQASRVGPSTEDGDAIKAIKARKVPKLIVGIDQSSYRWGYRNPLSKELEGFDIDLAHAIAEEILGDRDAITFRAITTGERVAALEDGTVDLVVRTMSINCERMKEVAFSTAYFATGLQLLAPAGSDITGYDDSLKDKRVCSAQGSTAYNKLQADPQGTAADDLTVPNQLDCLVRLQLGDADAILTDNSLAAGLMAQDPAIERVGEQFQMEYYGVAAKLTNTDLVARVNQALEDYRAGGANSPWMVSYRKWLAAGLPGLTAPPKALYKAG